MKTTFQSAADVAVFTQNLGKFYTDLFNELGEGQNDEAEKEIQKVLGDLFNPGIDSIDLVVIYGNTETIHERAEASGKPIDYWWGAAAGALRDFRDVKKTGYHTNEYLKEIPHHE
jgi:hypothetical protein